MKPRPKKELSRKHPAKPAKRRPKRTPPKPAKVRAWQEYKNRVEEE